MAIGPIIQLSADELAVALSGVESLDVVASDLVARTERRPDGQFGSDVRLARWRGRVAPSSTPGTDWVVLEDMRTGPLCVLPTAGLAAGRTAALSGLAARTLLAPGPITVALLGSGPAVRPQLVVITRQLRGVGRIAIHPATDDGGSPVESSELDHLDLLGIRFVLAATVDDAVHAANLVVAVDPATDRPVIGQLIRGAVVVNAVGLEWSADLAGSVDERYVDDGSLRADRLAGRPVDADLGQVLTGAHPGRMDPDHVVLFELLGAGQLDVRLASLVHRVALERALGTRLPG